MWTENFQIYKLNLKKAEELEIKLPVSIGSQRKQEHYRKKKKKKNYFCFMESLHESLCVN